jgi:hypothetical protein
MINAQAVFFFNENSSQYFYDFLFYFFLKIAIFIKIKTKFKVIDVYQSYGGPLKPMEPRFRALNNQLGDSSLGFAIVSAFLVYFRLFRKNKKKLLLFPVEPVFGTWQKGTAYIL